MRLAQRVRIPEIMDDPSLDPAVHAKALRGLSRLNLLSRNVSITWHELRRMFPPSIDTPLTLLDLASGAGDLPLALAKRAQVERIDLRVRGCDVSPVAVEFANKEARLQASDVEFFVHDAINDSLGEQYDFVMASLFFHHLSDEEAIGMLAKMKSLARRGILVNDLSRGYAWYGLVWIGSRIVTTSYVVHVDGPRSIASAFTPSEFQSLAIQAGLKNGTTRVRWPARFIYSWIHP